VIWRVRRGFGWGLTLADELTGFGYGNPSANAVFKEAVEWGRRWVNPSELAGAWHSRALGPIRRIHLVPRCPPRSTGGDADRAYTAPSPDPSSRAVPEMARAAAHVQDLPIGTLRYLGQCRPISHALILVT
jgi:hypothetical protein